MFRHLPSINLITLACNCCKHRIILTVKESLKHFTYAVLNNSYIWYISFYLLTVLRLYTLFLTVARQPAKNVFLKWIHRKQVIVYLSKNLLTIVYYQNYFKLLAVAKQHRRKTTVSHTTPGSHTDTSECT